MILITEKNDNRIIMMGNGITYLDNGYPMLIDKGVAFPSEMVNAIEVSEIPSEVIEEKYCYTETDGFYTNPNWEEPNTYSIPNDVYNSILDDYTNELIESGVL